MYRLSLCLAVVLSATVAVAAAPPTAEETAVQGLYEGVRKDPGGEQKFEARVVALGRGTFKIFVRQPQGQDKVAKVELEGKKEGSSVRFQGKEGQRAWEGTSANGAIRGTCGTGTFEMKRVFRKPPSLGAKPPKGAIVLLDGKDSTELVKRKGKDGSEPPWKPVADGGVEIPKGGMHSKRSFGGNFTLHVEFKCPLRPEARSQGRGNSGVYLPNGDEIQVLDSFGDTTYKGGGCGGLYAYKDPDTFDLFSLASLPPLEWQTYDIEYRVEQKDGKPTGNPRVTVLHNGIKIHDNVQCQHGARVGGFHFQDHGNPVHYRNIWILPQDK